MHGQVMKAKCKTIAPYDTYQGALPTLSSFTRSQQVAGYTGVLSCWLMLMRRIGAMARFPQYGLPQRTVPRIRILDHSKQIFEMLTDLPAGQR
jgi:hypothetical protein